MQFHFSEKIHGIELRKFWAGRVTSTCNQALRMELQSLPTQLSTEFVDIFCIMIAAIE
jgi:hypothetical protein